MGKEMSKILPGLFVGKLENAQDDADMMGNCITHVLSVHEPVKQTLQKSNSFQYFNINVKDEENVCILRYFSKSNDFIHEARCKNGNVLIHCLAGVSRAPTIVMAYLMTMYGLSCQEANNCLRCVRPNIKPNAGFFRQLEEFHGSDVDSERQRLTEAFGLWPNLEEDRKLLSELMEKFESLQTEQYYIDSSLESSLTTEQSLRLSAAEPSPMMGLDYDFEVLRPSEDDDDLDEEEEEEDERQKQEDEEEEPGAIPIAGKSVPGDRNSDGVSQSMSVARQIRPRVFTSPVSMLTTSGSSRQKFITTTQAISIAVAPGSRSRSLYGQTAPASLAPLMFPADD